MSRAEVQQRVSFQSDSVRYDAAVRVNEDSTAGLAVKFDDSELDDRIQSA